MKKESKIIDFYTRCMNCNNSSKECPNIWKDYQEGVIPRGFWFESPKIDILVVSKNPGHPFEKTGEKEFYKNIKKKDLFKVYRKVQTNYYQNFKNYKDKSTIFHKNLFRYVAYFLDLPENKIYTKIAHTNLVKCSTEDEQGILNKKTISSCYNKFFLEELKLFKPKIILALGKEVYNFLGKHKEEVEVPIIYIKHPSYYYRKDKEEQILNKIKKEIKSYLK